MNKKLGVVALTCFLGLGVGLASCQGGETVSSSEVATAAEITISRDAPARVAVGSTFNLEDFVTVTPEGTEWTAESNNENASVEGHTVTVLKEGAISIRITAGEARRAFMATAVSQSFLDIENFIGTIGDNYTIDLLTADGQVGYHVIHNPNYYSFLEGDSVVENSDGELVYAADYSSGAINFPKTNHTYNFAAYDAYEAVPVAGQEDMYSKGDHIGEVTDIQAGQIAPKGMWTAFIEPTLDYNSIVDSDAGFVSWTGQGLGQLSLYGLLAFSATDLTTIYAYYSQMSGTTIVDNSVVLKDGVLTTNLIDAQGNAQLVLKVSAVGSSTLPALEKAIADEAEPEPLKFTAFDEAIASVNAAKNFHITADMYAGGTASISGLGSFYWPASEEATAALEGWSNGYLGQFVDFGLYEATVDDGTYVSTNEEGYIDAFQDSAAGLVNITGTLPTAGTDSSSSSSTAGGLSAALFSNDPEDSIYDGTIGVQYGSGADAMPSYLTFTPGALTEENLAQIDWAMTDSMSQYEDGTTVNTGVATPYGDNSRLLSTIISMVPQAGPLAYAFVSSLTSASGNVAWYSFFEPTQVNLNYDTTGALDSIEFFTMTTGFGITDEVDNAELLSNLLGYTVTSAMLAQFDIPATQEMDTGILIHLVIDNIGEATIDPTTLAAINAAVATLA